MFARAARQLHLSARTGVRTSGRVALGERDSRRVVAALKVIEQGVRVDFVIPKEGAPAYLNVIAMTKGAPHAAEARKFINEARKFINYVIGAESPTKTCEILKLAPLNRKVRLSPETSKVVLTGDQMKQLVVFNEDAINRNKQAWFERWSR
jgi:putative spermidine/putrescine transport system substrate-binding protein